MNLPNAIGRAGRHLEGFADPEVGLRAGTPSPHSFLPFLRLPRAGTLSPHSFPPSDILKRAGRAFALQLSTLLEVS